MEEGHLQLFFDNLFSQLIIQAQLSIHVFEPLVLVLQIFELPDLTSIYTSVLFPPVVVCCP